MGAGGQLGACGLLRKVGKSAQHWLLGPSYLEQQGLDIGLLLCTWLPIWASFYHVTLAQAGP